MLYKPALILFFILAGIFLLPNFSHAGIILNNPVYIGLNSGLVGYWSFDGPDIAGDANSSTIPRTLYDRSGNSNDGKYYNATGTQPVIGKIGQALDFDGVDDFITVAHTNSFNIRSDITISAWIKRDILGTYDPILAKTDGVSLWDYELYICGAGTGCFPAQDNRLSFYSNATDAHYSSGKTISDTDWHYVSLTRQGSLISFYIDGVLDSTASEGTLFNDNSLPIKIGLDGPGWDPTVSYFDGSIDEVRVYNRALSAAEIKRLYRIGATLKLNVTLKDTLSSGLVGHWTFDGPDVVGVTAIDRSGQGNNGTLTNMATTINGGRVIGKIGQALDFDGVNDRVQATKITGATNWTASAWVKNEKGFQGQTVLDTWDGTNRITIESPCTNDTCIMTSNTYFERFPANPASDRLWHHIAYSWDGSNINFYYDGKRQSKTTSGTPDTANTQVLRIGEEAKASPGRPFDGLIDDVRIYNRAISADEIKRLYRIGATLKVNVTQKDTLTDGLVGHWTFDGPDVVGLTAIDRSGQGNNGTLTNGPTRTEGKIGQALRFDGANDCLQLVSNFTLDNMTAFTYSAWVKVNINTGVPSFFQTENASDGGDNVHIGIYTSNEFRGLVNYDNINNAQSLENVSFPIGSWQHVVATFSTSDKTVRLYRNGKEVTYASQTVGDVNPVSNAGVVKTIGGRSGGCLTRFVDGEIDDVRLYNRVLKNDEISRLYRLGAGK